MQNESQFCTKCVEERSNLCWRVLREILRNNQGDSVVRCPDTPVRHGEWTDWEIIEDCKGIEKVGASNLTCGDSRTIKRKDCQRSLGGKYCKNDQGEDVPENILVKTVRCQDRKCPGMVNI